ncbi:hypothetical protein [Albirhodobacter sp. R86504]|uniref:hypothetical protein n=1 Tax=Albirhodobacter sp. R86504 TaxID=3093848 RepID=UPI0036735D09
MPDCPERRANKDRAGKDLSPDDMRHPEPHVIDQRQQRIDPANEHTRDPNDRPTPNSKQPGTPKDDPDP